MTRKRKGLNRHQKAVFNPGEQRVRGEEIERLIELAYSEDPAERLDAAQNLCPCHVRKRVEAVWQALYRLMLDPDVRVRRAAWHTLEDGGCPNDPALNIAGGQVFAIFILRQFFQALPGKMFEAARIDGASEFQVFRHIGIPLSQSILGVVAIMHVLSTWNDIIWPLMTLSSDKLMTLTIGLYAFRTAYYTIWGPLMAGYVIASIPLIILFAFTSRLFVEGLSSGAIKM